MWVPASHYESDGDRNVAHQGDDVVRKDQGLHVSLSPQLFDEDNPLHRSDSKYIFTTEGHVVPIDKRFREKDWTSGFSYDSGMLPEGRSSQRPAPSNTSNVPVPSVNIVPLQKRRGGSLLASVFDSATGSRRSNATLFR